MKCRKTFRYHLIFCGVLGLVLPMSPSYGDAVPKNYRCAAHLTIKNNSTTETLKVTKAHVDITVAGGDLKGNSSKEGTKSDDRTIAVGADSKYQFNYKKLSWQSCGSDDYKAKVWYECGIGDEQDWRSQSFSGRKRSSTGSDTIKLCTD